MSNKVKTRDFDKIKNVCTSKSIIKGKKDTPQNGRKFFQITCLIRVLSTEYIKNSYNSTIKTEIIPLIHRE